MQVIKQLEDVQKTILNLENSKNYYKKQFEASIKDNETLRKHFDKMNKYFILAMAGLFAMSCAFIYTLLLK